MDNQQKLRALMLERGLTRLNISQIAGVSTSTVDSWLMPITSKHHRNLTDRMLEFLELKLKSSAQNL